MKGTKMFGNVAVVFALVNAMITAPSGAVVHQGYDKWNANSTITVTKISDKEFLLEEELNEEALKNWNNTTSMKAEAVMNAEGALETILQYGL